jgi:hypothetical protein
MAGTLPHPWYSFGMGLKLMALTLDALSILCIAVAVVAVLTLEGNDQRLLSSIAGVVLIICMSASTRITRGKQDALLKSKDRGGPVLHRTRDAIVLAGIGASLVGGWLIYSATDALEHRRTYLVVAAIVAACCIFVSHAIDHLAKQ